MFAQCPLCNAIFRVNAAQLGAARGAVRCGACHEVFDAIEHLRDDEFVGRAVIQARNREREESAAEPSEGHESASVVADRQFVETLPSFRRAVSDGSSGPSPSGTGHLPDDELAASPSRPAHELSSLRADVAQCIGAAAPSGGAGTDGPESELGRTPSAAAQVMEEHTVPEAIRADIERLLNRRAGQRKRVALMVGVGALSLGLLAQGLWFNPIEASRSYPQWQEHIERFCAVTGCTLPQRREPALVRVLSRDVRVHPRYEGALQITATLVNAAPFDQPYPHMSFSLFNVNGQTIATRTFSPAEYLGVPVAPNTLFETGSPLQIGLEVLAPQDVAVSFEFNFL